MTSTAFSQHLVLRPATAADAAVLRDLADLDSRRLPAGPHLVALADGELRAALSLADGTAVADPFHPSTELVALLRARATAGARPSLARRLRLRLRPRPRVAHA